jgi:hypothetical protein
MILVIAFVKSLISAICLIVSHLIEMAMAIALPLENLINSLVSPGST